MNKRSEDQKNVASAPLNEPLQGALSSQPAADPHRDTHTEWASQIVEANEQLVLASLHAEKMIETAAHYLDEATRVVQRDALTDIPNRALMFDRLEHAIAAAERSHSRIAVLFVDLDHFKQINDRQGHAAGDEVLKLVARALESVVRRSDTVSRHGGDEFLVLLPEISKSSAVALIAMKMLAALAAPVRVGEAMLSLSASIGIAVFPEDATDASTLIQCADKAMYRSKRRAPGHFAFHRPVLQPLRSDVQPLLQAARELSDHGQGGRTRPGRLQLVAANAHLLIDAPEGTSQDDRRDALTRSFRFQAKAATELSSPFSSAQESLDLLGQVQTEDPLLRVLIDREVAHLSAPAYRPFDSPRVPPARFIRFETVKTGKFDAIDADGLRCTVLEFTVTAHCGTLDQTRRSQSEKSFGLANGDRVNRVNHSDFQIVSSGLLVQRV